MQHVPNVQDTHEILDDLKAGRKPAAGPRSGRYAAEPFGEQGWSGAGTRGDRKLNWEKENYECQAEKTNLVLFPARKKYNYYICDKSNLLPYQAPPPP